jgi:hypothetical protein
MSLRQMDYIPLIKRNLLTQKMNYGRRNEYVNDICKESQKYFITPRFFYGTVHEKVDMCEEQMFSVFQGEKV